MTIKLEIDFDGQPYLELESFHDDSVEGKMLSRFIELATKRGLKLEHPCVDGKDCDQHLEIVIAPPKQEVENADQ